MKNRYAMPGARDSAATERNFEFSSENPLNRHHAKTMPK
jgi:hypothetical protein